MRHMRIPLILLTLSAIILFGGSAQPSAVTNNQARGIPVELSCDQQVIALGPHMGPATPDVDLVVVLAEFPEDDPACLSANPVRSVRTRIDRLAPGTRLLLHLENLGLQITQGCESYVLTVQASRPGGGRTTTSCEGSLTMAAANTIDCTAPAQVSQINNDLIFSHGIDLQAIGSSPPEGCLSIREYAAQVRNISTTTYGVEIHSEYVCATNASNANSACQGSVPEADGENSGTAVNNSLGAGCFTIDYLADNSRVTLPACCDTDAEAAVQCASYSVTKIGKKTCSPAFVSPEMLSFDLQPGITLGFNCSALSPARSDTQPSSTSCFADCDLDGLLGDRTDPAVPSTACGTCSAPGFPASCDSSPCSTTTCGNDVCETGEDCNTCPADCPGVQQGNPNRQFCCGSGGCEAAEDACLCPLDCGSPPRFELGLCTDGIDNDCDGLADCDDVDCSGGSVPDPACECSPVKEKGPRCNDGIDNDCDGLIDGDDPDC